MCTVQNYAGQGASATPNEPTAKNLAPTVEIPAYLLQDEDNRELAELTRLLLNPAVSSIKPHLVLAAINAAYTLGTHQSTDSNSVLLPLYLNRPRFGLSQMSHFEVVSEALNAYRLEMAALRTDYGMEVIADIDEVQGEMMAQLYQITNNLIG